MGASLIEAVVSLSLTALLGSALAQQASTAAIFAHSCWATQREIFDARQIEQLTAGALAAAQQYPRPGGPLLDVGRYRIRIGADLDRDGSLDASSAESTIVSLDPSSGTYRLRYQTGRQIMTIAEELSTESRFEAFNELGEPTYDAARVTLISLHLGHRGKDVRSTYFAIDRQQ